MKCLWNSKLYNFLSFALTTVEFTRFSFSFQVKNIIYHAVKDALNSLKHYEREQNSTKGRMESDAVL